ncbi:phenylalanyl-tRNA synthetase alpha chain (plasmid) [Azospirillum sp. B510]|uniref:phenylalanine--tRNA ligase subunit alpha n=1 Tax=Azospirillum sp. (strain B510) TaxID=137722 RepID=UPI0001C4B897|nr:phenylalanine--tRNA ligase subunit alpha [Azospirillum sp. B510]BAI74131.1 phenylalanyl-tRNA synthetase alpha chain [Azospirillum sp. B510]
MSTNTELLQNQLAAELSEAREPKDIEALRVKYLGRQGLIAGEVRGTDFSTLSEEEKREAGRRVSSLKAFAEAAIGEARAKTEERAARARRRGLVDLTLPGTGARAGSLHPVTQTQMFLEDVFQSMGFRVETGFEVEDEFYNFDALNIPGDHPARDMHDTFWLEDGRLLRTHTSATQVRAMRMYGAPLRAVFPGRCFRNEATDTSHETTFHQFEGLMIDEDVTVATVLAVMEALLRQVFGREVSVRLRPGYFPFVEPGFELDLRCLICGGNGCRVCKQTGWVELMPCGMVHPNVLRAGGIDQDRYRGFAFGLGLTRLTMMNFSIPDIRLLGSGDLRLLDQFPAVL